MNNVFWNKCLFTVCKHDYFKYEHHPQVVSIERLEEFANLQSEADWREQEFQNKNIMEHGAVDFQDYRNVKVGNLTLQLGSSQTQCKWKSLIQFCLNLTVINLLENMTQG